MNSVTESTHPRHEDTNELPVRRRTYQDSSREPKDKKLWEVSLQFEALLLQQMMSAMRKTVPESEVLPTGFASDMYNSMFDQLVAEAGSRRSSLGIAENIYRQLDQSQHTQARSLATDRLHIGRSSQGGKHGEG